MGGAYCTGNSANSSSNSRPSKFLSSGAKSLRCRSRRHLCRTREVVLRGIMEAPCMDADKPKISINLAQNELDRARAEYAAEKARKLAEADALSRVEPGDKLDSFPNRP